MKRGILKIGIIAVIAALMAGCAGRVSFVSRGENVGEHRWKVEKLNYSRLSRDQQAVVSEKGKPDYIKLYHPMRKRGTGLIGRLFRYVGSGLQNFFINSWRPADAVRKIEAWVYEKEGAVVWFKEGKRVEYVAVEE